MQRRQEMIGIIDRALQEQANVLQRIAATQIESIESAALAISSARNVITTGVGKSSFIAQKMAASLVSIGRDARFLHPTDAQHGDIGVIRDQSVIVLFSKSGQTHELYQLLQVGQLENVRRIIITANQSSSFCRSSDVLIQLPIVSEYDVDNLLPTASTTTSMAVADCIVAAVASTNVATTAILRLTHPQGAIGKVLLTSVADVISRHPIIPSVSISASLNEALDTLNTHARGIVCGVDDDGRLIGIMTDGDVRRLVQRGVDIASTTFVEVATTNPVVAKPQSSLHEAVQLMEDRQRKISVLPVVDSKMMLVGVIQLHDIVSFQVEMQRS